MFRKSALALGGLALGALAFQTPAHAADASVKAGLLTCQVASGWGFIFGSSRSLRCVYSGAGAPENYVGKISKFGVDIGYQQSGVILWEVFAPNDHPDAGALDGHYGGVTASAAVGVGAGANALIGGSSRSISLQPVSIQGMTGLNVAAGVGELTLTSSHDRD